MFSAIIICAVGVTCGLTGEFHSAVRYPDRAQCLEMTAMGLKMIGENPAHFRIKCAPAGGKDGRR